jgi:hypothetical protein
MSMLGVGTMASVFAGVNLVLNQNTAYTTVGILLVIFSAVVFLVGVKDFLLLTDERAGH